MEESHLPNETNTSLRKDGSGSPTKSKPMKDLTPIVPKTDDKVKITFPDGREIELPFLHGSAGPPMIDI